MRTSLLLLAVVCAMVLSTGAAHAETKVTPPSAYTIASALAGPDAGTMAVYRNGALVLIEVVHPARADGTPADRALTQYDLKAMTSVSWYPAAASAGCSAGTFSGDWGDPFAMTVELSASID